MGAYSRLDAVNHMLLYSGEHIVNHLEDDSGVDSSIAEKILDDTITAHCMRGLVNNVYNKEYIPDTNGLVYLPQLTLFVDLVTPVYGGLHSWPVRVTYKGSPPRLFNVTDNTDDWSGKPVDKVEIVLTVDLDWDDIETAMQRGIMASAARDYQMITQGDDKVDQYLAQREVVYTSKGRAADIHSKRKNFLLGDIGARLASFRHDPRFSEYRHYRG